VKMLQAHSAENDKSAALRLAIQVGSKRLQTAATNTDEWLTYSGSYNGWRHTSLSEITPVNVAELRIRWIKQFDINVPLIEATPLVIDGVIFMPPDAGHVLALDAKTGDVIWEYKRSIPADLPLANGPVNRGLAVHGSTLFFGRLDGYLIAMNANDGKVIWESLVASPAEGYSITGAPLIVNRSVIVGISGADQFRIRGFLAAYDVSTGRRLWKFDTIPGPGEVGHETWENDAWRTGGGATWVTGSYDPSTDLLYWGVGNPSPAFSRDVRPGDNLFTASVIALHASTGKLAWYFQFTPHDEHDRDAAQTPVLADLLITGVDVAQVSTAGRRARPGISGGT
jgi:alcohol dehydrogenase (cytochrome c)